MPIIISMRPRWTLIVVLFAAAILAVYAVCRGQGGAVDTLVGMARRFSYGALFAVGFWSCSMLLQKWMSQPTTAPLPVRTQAVGYFHPPIPTFPVDEEPGAAKYKVSGVDHDTRFEITEFIFADSPSSAQLKVELKGVDVAAVEKA